MLGRDRNDSRSDLTFTVPAIALRNAYIDRKSDLLRQASALDAAADRLQKAISANPAPASVPVELAADLGLDDDNDGAKALGQALYAAEQPVGLRTMAFHEAQRLSPKILRAKATELRREADLFQRLSDFVTERDYTLTADEIRNIFRK